jgi:hypothetical protein
MRMVRMIGGTILVVGSVACGAADLSMDAQGKLTLSLPRPPTADEMLVVKISVGPIGQRTKIVVRAPDQEIAGTIVPFGIRPGQKAGTHTIPVPAKAVLDKKVTLRLEVLENGAKAARAPTRAEIEDAKLAYIPVSKRPEKGKL